ncbi:hypothetical protein [Aureivirga marina]|uniref:hypothetical protein n=1 Tax=Aureivirga marina TaxID=1182451 RepID=UPI0018CA1897|nr:hypothetical protein [Aureivirga marina]
MEDILIFVPKKQGYINAKYTNEEEKYTTTLSNQINENLREDTRNNYGGVKYKTKSSITTEKK